MSKTQFRKTVGTHGVLLNIKRGEDGVGKIKIKDDNVYGNLIKNFYFKNFISHLSAFFTSYGFSNNFDSNLFY